MPAKPKNFNKSYKVNNISPQENDEERTQLVKGFGTATDPKILNPFPSSYFQRFSSHLYNRLEKGRKLIYPRQHFEMIDDEVKMLSMIYHPISDTVSYKLHLNLSVSKRGLVEGGPQSAPPAAQRGR